MKTKVKIMILTEGCKDGDKHVVVEIEDLDKALPTDAGVKAIVKTALANCDDAHAISFDELKELAAKAKSSDSKSGDSKADDEK